MNHFPPSDSAAPPPADELISRHFDGSLSEAEHQTLTRLLHDDPQALADFAATARLHHGLENLFPARSRMKRKHPLRRFGPVLAAAALVAVIGGGQAVFRPAADGGDSRARVTVTELNPPPADSVKPVPASLRKRIVKAAGAAALSAGPAEMEELLGRYYVNVSPHNLTVPQALKQLEQAIRDVNLLNRPELNGLSFTAGESKDPDADDPVVRTLRTAPMTAENYLKICGLFRPVTRQPAGVTYGAPLRSRKGEEGGDQMQTRVYQVREDFLEIPPALSPSPPAPGSTDLKPTAKTVLSEFYGLDLAEGEAVTFHSTTGKLVAMRWPVWKLDLLEQRIEHRQLNREDPLVRISSVISMVPQSLLPPGFDELSGAMLPEVEKEDLLMVSTNGEKGAVFARPAVAVRPGQRGSVEVDTTAGHVDSWKGLSLDFSATPLGELFKIEGVVILHDPTDTSWKGPYSASQGADRSLAPGRFATECELYIPRGQSALFTVDGPAAGGQVNLVCISPSLDSEIPFATPVAGKPGFVLSPFLNHGEVDVTGIPQGVKVRCPYSGKVFRVP